MEPTRFVLPSLHPPKIGFTIGKQRLSRSLGLAVDFLLPPAANFVTGRAFNLRESIFIVALLLLGGSGNIRGPILGATVMILLPEILRFVGLPSAIASSVREIIYGLTLVVLMYWRPKGLAGDYGLR